jgi:ATP-binding cassette, subfamily B, bacterial
MVRSHPLLRCFYFYRPHLRLFIAATVVAFIVNLSLPITQLIIGFAIDDLRHGQAVKTLADGSFDLSGAWYWLMVLIIFATVRGGIQYGNSVMSVILGQRLLHDMRATILRHVQQSDQRYYLMHGTGEIVTRTTRDSDKVRDAVVGGWRTLLETGLIIIGCLGVLAWYDPMLALVPALLIMIGMWWFIRQTKKLMLLNRAAGDAYDKVTQELAEGVGGVRVIKSFALESVRSRSFSHAISLYTGHAYQALMFSVSRLPLPQMLVGMSHVWILWYGALLVAEHQVTLGELIAALMIITAIIFRVENVGRTMQVFAEASASAERIMELLDSEPTIRSGTLPFPSNTGPLGIHFEHVACDSPAGGRVLDDFHVRINPGEIVALVGKTGCGKSTIASLLPRLVDPRSGHIAVGNEQRGWTAITEFDLESLRKNIQVAYQESFLFSDTIRANILHGNAAASDEQINNALRAAQAHEIVAQLPQGLATVIGERGTTLSGGQRQRLCLARALIAQPKIMCLDDATSALDAVTERAILSYIKQAPEQTTVLLIASKLASVVLADRVIFVDQGRIIEQGTHSELCARSSDYRALLGIDA